MKKLLSTAMALVLIIGLLTGCSVESQGEKTESVSNQYYLYYLNKDETKVTKTRYYPEQESAEFMLQDLMGILNGQESSGENLPLLPAGVQLVTYRLNESLLELEFNADYSNISRTREILVRAGVARTFLQIPGITGIKIFIGNQELTDSKGQAVGLLDGNTFVEMWGSDKDAYRYDTFTLYFTDKSGKKLVKETRNVYYRRTLPRERVVLEQLAKGPMEEGHYPTIPETSVAVSVITADRICYVNMNDAFQSEALDVAENIPVYSVVNSILDSCEADRVQISIEGSLEGNYEDNMPLYNFYEKNEDLIVQDEAKKDS